MTTESLGRQIQRRVVLLSAVAIFSSLVAVGLTLLVVLQTIQLRLNNASSTVALTFESFLGNVQSDLVATSAALQNYSSHNANLLRQLLQRQLSIFELMVVDKSGNVLLQRRRVGVQNLFTLPTQPWLETVQTKQVYVSPVQTTDGVPAMNMAVAVLDESGQFTATLVAHIDLTTLWNQVVSFPVGETGYVYIADDGGQLLVYRDLSLLAQNPHLPQFVNYTSQVIEVANIWIYRGLAQTWVISTYLRLQSVPWYIIVEQPLYDLRWPFLIQFIFFILIILIIGGLVYSIFNFTRHRVVAPLLRLQEGVTMFAQGHVEHTIDLPDRNELGLLASTFNDMTRQLANFIHNLESLVQQRTQALETSAAVSRQIAMILNLDQLALEVVKLIQLNFHFYYAQIYLLDQHRQLVFMAGAGSQGEQLEATGQHLHYLTIGEGIIGTTAQKGEPLVYNNVAEASMFIYHPMLPNTQSELAVPIQKNGQIMGVLDIESEQLERFGPADIKLIESIADQIAIAVDNARLYTELAKTNADKDRFFSIVAHDLKGPFMPLLGYSELLIESAERLSPSEITAMGTTIQRTAKNVYALLENLLQWARLQMGRMQYQPQTIDLAELARKSVELLSANATAKNITLRNTVPKGLTVFADTNMLDTVIRNLTNNALKFTPRNGEITISARPQEDDFVQIFIADTGVGMTPEVKDKLFRIDQHVTTVGTAKEQGTGLGLIICQEMVVKSGGRIWVESEVGKGTTVKFTVRLDKQATQPDLSEPETVEMKAIILPEAPPIFVAPAMDTLIHLLGLARAGDMLGLEREAKQLETVEIYRPFAQHLYELARGFEDEAIMTWLKEYLATN